MIIRSPWLQALSPDSDKTARLLCFPFAGGGALSFRCWHRDLPSHLDVCPVQLPGRENRIREAALTDSRALVRELAEALVPCFDRPVLFFGHSMGAKLAYAVAWELGHRFGLSPACLIASGSRAPNLRRPNPLTDLPEDQFIQAILTFEGTPRAVFEHPDLREIFIPLLMADFRLDNDLFRSHENGVLHCPIHAFCGSGDPEAEEGEVMAWSDFTTDTFTFTRFSGGHFFISGEEAAVLDRITTLSHGVPAQLQDATRGRRTAI